MYLILIYAMASGDFNIVHHIFSKILFYAPKKVFFHQVDLKMDYVLESYSVKPFN